MFQIILIHETFVAHADSLNAFASALLFLIALVVIWGFRPQVFANHPYTRTAFLFWMLEWLSFVLIWLLNANKAFPDPRWFLMTVDLSTIFTLGFFVVFWEGSNYQGPSTILNLSLIYVLLIFWNLGFAIWALASPQGSDWRWIWVAASEAMSAAAFGLIAVAFVYRYRGTATAFALVTVAYVILQQPIYAGTFVKLPTEPGWVGALALGKLVYGVLFYTLYFTPAENYDPITSPIARLSHNPALRKGIHWVGALAGGIALGLLTEYSSRGIDKTIHHFFAHP